MKKIALLASLALLLLAPVANATSYVMMADEERCMIEDSIPQNLTLVLKDLDKHFTEEGYHTLEIVHETPFGSEILASSQIRVDRTVEVNGGLYVGE